jgi:DNA-binding PadR family transcriptional regulator
MRRSAQLIDLLRLFLARPSDWLHGYDITNRLGISAGTLYPLLARVEREGWFEARWEESTTRGRPPRRCYRLTSTGARLAAQFIAERPIAGRRAAPLRTES